jgi:hypothetical protein
MPSAALMVPLLLTPHGTPPSDLQDSDDEEMALARTTALKSAGHAGPGAVERAGPDTQTKGGGGGRRFSMPTCAKAAQLDANAPKRRRGSLEGAGRRSVEGAGRRSVAGAGRRSSQPQLLKQQEHHGKKPTAQRLSDMTALFAKKFDKFWAPDKPLMDAWAMASCTRAAPAPRTLPLHACTRSCVSPVWA